MGQRKSSHPSDAQLLLQSNIPLDHVHTHTLLKDVFIDKDNVTTRLLHQHIIA